MTDGQVNGAQPALADRQLEAGGRVYTLRFSVRAMAALQDHYGVASFNDVAERLQNVAAIGAGDLVAIVWAGLRTHHPEVTKDEVLGILDEIGPAGVLAVTGEAFAAAAPPDGVGAAETDTDPLA